MKPVRRLAEDREFLLRTGLRFEDEAALLQPRDLDSLRTTLEARIAAGAVPVLPAPTSPRWLPLGVGAVCLVAGLSWWLLGNRGAPLPAVRTPSLAAVAPVAPLATPVNETRVVRSRPLESETASPRMARETPPPARVKRAPAVEERLARAAPTRRQARRLRSSGARSTVVKAPDPPVPLPPAAQPATSTLAEQLALYDRGLKALASGRLGPAIAAFRAYRARFPGGELTNEASISLLEALVRARRSGAVVTLASALSRKPGLRHRQAGFLRVKAEAEARLGRCQAAERSFGRALAAKAKGVDAAAILDALRHCRRIQAAPGAPK